MSALQLVDLENTVSHGRTTALGRRDIWTCWDPKCHILAESGAQHRPDCKSPVFGFVCTDDDDDILSQSPAQSRLHLSPHLNIRDEDRDLVLSSLRASATKWVI